VKFNLKNRPKSKGFFIDGQYFEEIENWFEGFEKQEREKNRITVIKIEELGDAKQIPLERLGFLRGYLQRGKEILGES